MEAKRKAAAGGAVLSDFQWSFLISHTTPCCDDGEGWGAVGQVSGGRWGEYPGPGQSSGAQCCWVRAVGDRVDMSAVTWGWERRPRCLEPMVIG